MISEECGLWLNSSDPKKASGVQQLHDCNANWVMSCKFSDPYAQIILRGEKKDCSIVDLFVVVVGGLRSEVR